VEYVGYVIGSLVGIILGFAVGFFVKSFLEKKSLEQGSKNAAGILNDAQKEAARIIEDARLKAKDELLKNQELLQEEIKKEKDELKQLEKRLTKREDSLDTKDELLNKKESQLRTFEERLVDQESRTKQRESEVVAMEALEKAKLHEVARMTQEEARDEILRRTARTLESEIQTLYERATLQARERAEEEAKKNVAVAIGRLAVEYTTEHVVSSVELPTDEMKGRIIGREGRNIRAFENATGVDVIVDDTPGVVVLSGFEAVRREIAVRSMSKLVADGRIHPARIEEVVIKTREEMEKVIEETGKQVALELDVRNLKPREIMLLGRLKFRTSYGQNILDHSREVGFLSGMIASEIGLDEALARRCGLLHDIGKAVDHEEEGTHPQIGAEVVKRCNEPPEVVIAVEQHHSTTPVESLYATVVQIADAISASRPGARRETLEKYVKRLERLETIAKSYPEVQTSFAIQAGRELRVIARSEKVDDADAARICRQIATQIENELTYPGEVRVTMIREVRITEYAR